MKRIITIYGEGIAVLLLYLAFYLARKGYVPDVVYISLAATGMLWFVPVKIYLRIVNTESTHKVLYAVSSVIMAGLIALSVAGLYLDHTELLRNAARVLFYLNIVLMLYGFFKAVEGQDYIGQLAMVFFGNAIIDKLG